MGGLKIRLYEGKMEGIEEIYFEREKIRMKILWKMDCIYFRVFEGVFKGFWWKYW